MIYNKISIKNINISLFKTRKVLLLNILDIIDTINYIIHSKQNTNFKIKHYDKQLIN